MSTHAAHKSKQRAEIVALRAEVETLRRELDAAEASHSRAYADEVARTVAAEAALAELRGKVEALIAEWSPTCTCSAHESVRYRGRQLAAILAEPKP